MAPKRLTGVFGALLLFFAAAVGEPPPEDEPLLPVDAAEERPPSPQETPSEPPDDEVLLPVEEVESAESTPSPEAAEQQPPPEPPKSLELADFEPGRADRLRVIGVPGEEGLGMRPDSEVAFDGRGSLRMRLPAGGAVLLEPETPIDARDYPFLELAVRAEEPRNDLFLTLRSDSGDVSLPREVLREGWNRIGVDLRPLADVEGFDPSAILRIRLELRSPERPATLWLDRVRLDDNRGYVEPSPEGLELLRIAGDYILTLPPPDGQVRITRSPDGLWRLGVHQPTLKLAARGDPLPSGGEYVALLGDHRAGQLEIAEHNAVRLRIVSSWYFFSRSGLWQPREAACIRWQWCFYGDGRWVTHLELNSPEEDIGKLSLHLPGRRAAWADGEIVRRRRMEDFTGRRGSWSYFRAPGGEQSELLQNNYLQPGKVEILIGRPLETGPQGFDRSQGCYVVSALEGQCRFRFLPAEGGISRPVFRISGPWKNLPSINFEGLPIRRAALLEDGSVLFALPGVIRDEATIEVRGDVQNP